MAASPFAVVLRHLERMLQGAPGEGTSDAQILERYCATKDHAAFEALVRRHGPLVWRVCCRLLQGTDGAEDAFQATFLVLARRAGAIRKPGSLPSWLHGVAFRICRKVRADLGRQGRIQSPRPTSSLVDPAREAASREIGRIIEEEVHALPERLRIPILLCYWEGKTNDETARQLGWAAGTVKTRLAKAREGLHTRLLSRGVTLSIGAVSLLLAPDAVKAALPAGLLASAIHVTQVGVAGNLGASAHIIALAEAAMNGATSFKLLATSILALGIGAAAIGLGGGTTPPEKAPTRNEPAAVVQKSQDAETLKEPALDRHGDPLPDGVLARFGTARLRHADGVVVAFAGEKAVVSTGRDSSFRYWDVATGSLSRKLPGPHGDFRCACNPDGSILATWNHKPPGIALWDLKVGKLLRIIPLKTYQDSRDLAFTADGKSLGVIEDDKFHLYDPATGDEKTLPFKVPYRPDHIALSPDGKVVAICNRTQGIVLREVDTGNERRRIQDKEGTCVAFAPDGKTLAVAGGYKRGARLYDPETGAAKGELPILPRRGNRGDYYHMAFSHDGRILATVGGAQPAVLWDVAERKELHRLPVTWASGMTFSTDDKTFAISVYSSIRLWDTRTGKELHPNEGQTGEVNAVAISPDGRFVVSGSYWDYSVHVWDSASGRLLHVLDKNDADIRKLDFGLDGETFVSAGGESVIRQWNAVSGKQIREFPLKGPNIEVTQQVRNLRHSADGKIIAAVSSGYGGTGVTLWAWDADTGKEIVRRPFVHEVINDCGFSPDAKTIVGGDKDRVVLEDVLNGKTRKLPMVHGPLAFSKDGAMLAVAKSAGETLAVWDLARDRESLAMESGGVGFASFSWDGRYLASAGYESLRLWELASGKEVLSHAAPEKTAGWFGHAFVSSLAYSRDGRSVVTGLIDSTILKWDLIPDRQAIRKAAGSFAPEDLERLWADLGAKDAAKAYVATHALASGPPPKILAFLERRLKPAKGVDAERLKKLVQDLGSDKFAIRDAAGKELENSLEDIRPALERALELSLPLESQRRLERLLARPMVLPPGDTLRSVRAVALLEKIGTLEARRFLDQLTQGPADARLTREAVAALARLSNR